MAPISPIPPNLHQLSLRVRRVDPSTLVRLAWKDPTTHLSFRRDARFRFDAPDASFGVLYAAFDLRTAFVETVIRGEPLNAAAGGPVILSYAELEPRRVITFKKAPAGRDLRLIELLGEGLLAARTDNQISAADDYKLTQRWAGALYAHPLLADGLVYVSRYFAPNVSVVLFDRSTQAMEVGKITPLLSHTDLPELVHDLGLAIERP